MVNFPDHLSATFGALGDPTRRAMVARLARGAATVGELAAPFRGAMSLPAITKHVQVLERAGLVTKTRQAQRRTCALNGAALQVAANWLDAYRAHWEASLDRLGEYLRRAQAAASPETAGAPASAAPAPRASLAKPRRPAASAKRAKPTRSAGKRSIAKHDLRLASKPRAINSRKKRNPNV